MKRGCCRGRVVCRGSRTQMDSPPLIVRTAVPSSKFQKWKEVEPNQSTSAIVLCSSRRWSMGVWGVEKTVLRWVEWASVEASERVGSARRESKTGEKKM